MIGYRFPICSLKLEKFQIIRKQSDINSDKIKEKENNNPNMKFENIFVTVGTTEFNSLIEKIHNEKFSKILQKLNCKKLIIQFGNGTDFDFKHLESIGIDVETYRLKTNIINDIKNADLIISHAGAGTCTEVLKLKKHLIVVINTELMHNHQTELAEKLFKDKHLFYCEPLNLDNILLKSNFNELIEYPKGDMNIFIKKLDELMEFV